MLRKIRRVVVKRALAVVVCILLFFFRPQIQDVTIYKLWADAEFPGSVVSRGSHMEEESTFTSHSTISEDTSRDRIENSAKDVEAMFLEESQNPPGDLIDDTDVIEALKQFKFYMKSTANSTLVDHQYIAGQFNHDMYRQLCENVSYDLSVLPTASVIISFHQNERLLSILHTLHSIHLNSPTELLKEIILIDDNSKKVAHKKTMEDYIHDHFPDNLIKIYRHYGEEQLGLIKGRLLGIKMATGDVVVCMDAHMELQPGWLEPLVQSIHDQRNTMATCHLDWMRPDDNDPNRWVYTHGLNNMKTTWVWKTFNFGFRHVRKTEMNHEKYSIAPLHSPMSVGTLWAMDKSFFFEIGAFDEGMVLWGAENVDLPIRVHLCSGGRVVNMPCCKAAHQEMRHQRDYRAGWKRHFNVNFKRLAEVWIDGEYKETFDYYNQPLQSVDPGDLSERRSLKRNCPHNYSYYMQKAFPEMGVDAISFAWQGMVNLGSKLCFYYSHDESWLGMKSCTPEPGKERSVFLNLNGQLRQYLSIFNIKTYSDKSVLKRCDYFYEYFNTDSHTAWIHTKDGCVYAPKEQLCLGVGLGLRMVLLSCNGTCTDPTMQWRFRKYTHYYKELYDGYFKRSGTGHTEQSTVYYQNYRKMLHVPDKPVLQTDIDSSVENFMNFIT